MHWNEHQLEVRDSLAIYFTRTLTRELNKINTAFRFMRIETPILLPFSVEPEKLQSVQIRLDNEQLVLRENTLTGAYEVSKNILSGKAGPKQRLPIVIWQHGKVFERINGKVIEKYNLEYQVLFSKTTGMPYEPVIAQACANMVVKQCGQVVEDAKPGIFQVYAADTQDLLVTIRERDDFWAGKNIEVVLDMDQCTLASIRHDKIVVRNR